jgi:hypothetical protein
MFASGVIVMYILITLMELIPLWKDKKIKYITAYLSVMMVSLIISISLILGVKLPFISSIIRSIFKKG